MSVSSRRNKKAHRQSAAAAAAAAAHERKKRRRVLATVVAGVLILIIVGATLQVLPSDEHRTVAPSTTLGTFDPDTTPTSAVAPTTVPALPSAKGKPCVAVADSIPKGAPPVPVKIGPPPEQLVTEDLKVGDGAVVTASQTVTVDYIGVACSTGAIFDSSWSRGQPATFALNQVIKGWTDGIPGMRVGGRRLLGIPSDQAYGETGSGAKIAPDEALWFVVDVKEAT